MIVPGDDGNLAARCRERQRRFVVPHLLSHGARAEQDAVRAVASGIARDAGDGDAHPAIVRLVERRRHVPARVVERDIIPGACQQFVEPVSECMGMRRDDIDVSRLDRGADLITRLEEPSRSEVGVATGDHAGNRGVVRPRLRHDVIVLHHQPVAGGEERGDVASASNLARREACVEHVVGNALDREMLPQCGRPGGSDIPGADGARVVRAADHRARALLARAGAVDDDDLERCGSGAGECLECPRKHLRAIGGDDGHRLDWARLRR